MISPLLLLTLGACSSSREGLTLGAMLAAVALAMGFLAPLTSLVEMAFQLQVLGRYVERVQEVMSAAPEQDPHAPPRYRPSHGWGGTRERLGALRGATFRGRFKEFLSRRLPAGSSRSWDPSGSGKSTLSRVLLGLLTPQSGRVLLDGQDLSSLDVHSVRRQVSLVPQHPYLFEGSIRENISFGDPGASEEDVVRGGTGGADPSRHPVDADGIRDAGEPRAAPLSRAASGSGSPSPERF
jgi:ABC-type multidrug transport system fused ATPase/permease subunit